jgi:HEAT repeat protein
MGVSEIINISGILIGILAVAYNTILYVRAYYNQQSIRLGTVGIFNIFICVSMATIVIIAVYATPSDNNGSTSFIAHLTLFSVLVIGLFIVCQTVYLFSPLSPIKQFIAQKSEKEQTSAASNDPLARVEGKLRTILQNKSDIKYLQIFDMSFPLHTTKMYRPTKVYTEPLQFSSEQIEMLEEQFTPLDRLNRKLEIVEERNEGAMDPLQIIIHEKQKQYVLLGEPGIGKTTYLKFLTISLATKNEASTKNFLPLYISLNDYANNMISNLFEYIIEVYRKRYFPPEDTESLRELIIRKLIDGSAFILLDGLDETFIGNDANKTYEAICKKISEFAGAYEKAPIIVTSRKASYELRTKLAVTRNDIRGREFKCLEIAGFLRDDVRNFVGQWFEERPSDDKEISAANLLLKLEQDSRLRELSGNPLLLSILTLAYTRGMEISRRRAKLYDNCTSALLKDWDKSRTIERTNDALLTIQYELPELKNDILKELAWHFHKLELSYFSKEDALAVIEKPLKRKRIPFELKEHILNEIIINSGLLKQDSEYSLCSFSHITFQEYFAAKYMVDVVKSGNSSEESEANFLNKWSDPWWEEVILLYAGLTTKLHSVLKFLMNADGEDIYYSKILFAGRCIAATSAQSGEKAEEVIQKLYAILHDPAQEGLTKEVATLLYKHLADRVANTLIEIANQDVNLSLLKILGADIVNYKVCDESFMVSEKIVKGIGETARICIVDALGTCSDQRVPGELKDLLVNHADGKQLDNMLASHIAYTLGKLGNQSVAGDLAEYLNRTSSGSNLVDLHISIIDALRSLRDASVIPQLCKCLRSPNVNNDEKIKIAYTLGVLGFGSLIDGQETKDIDAATTQELKNTLSQTLLDLIRNQKASEDVNYAKVQYACIGTFGRWHATSMIPELQKLRDSISSWPLSSRIAVVLNLLGDDSMKPVVLSLLSDKNASEQARIELIQFLVEQNAKSLAPQLVPRLFDDTINTDVRCNLAEAMGKVGNEEVAKRLLKHLSDKSLDPSVCSKMILALGALCDSGKLEYAQLMESLYNLLLDPNTNTNSIKPDTVMDILGPSTDDIPTINPNTDVDIIKSCAEVISEIGELKDREFVKKLLDTIQKAKREEKLEEYLKSFSIILGSIGDKTVCNALKDLLLKERLAIKVLVGVGSPEQKRIIKVNVSTAERKRIAKALITLNDSSIVPELISNLHDTTLSPSIRESIVKVIKHIAKDKKTCEGLLGQIEQADIYEAVWEISRRGQLRVYRVNNKKILVEKMKLVEIGSPAVAGSQAKY